MATTRIMPLHVGKGRIESRAISDIIDYVANPPFSAGYNKKEHSTTSKEGFYDRTAHCRSNGM